MHGMNEPGGTLRIERPARVYRDRFRSYKIFVDNELRGHIRRGETLEIPELKAGTHIVAARIDFSASREIPVNVTAGKTLSLVVRPAGSAFQFWRAFSRDMWLDIQSADEPGEGEPKT